MMDVFYPLPSRPSKGSHSKKKGPRTPSPPPPVPLDLPVVGKKHKGKHKNKEKSEEKQKEAKDRGQDAEKHKEKKEKRRCGVIQMTLFSSAVIHTRNPCLNIHVFPLGTDRTVPTKPSGQ